jgi:hypothetical protein
MRILKAILLALAILIIVGIGIVLVIAETQFGLIRAGKPQPHDTYVTDATRARIVIHPLLAQDILQTALPENRKPPEWLISRVLPHEVAIILNPDIEQRTAELVVYINEQRAGPIVADLVNRSGFMGQYDYLSWDGGGLTMEQRGEIIARGNLVLNDRVVSATRSHWGRTEGLSRLDIEGGHFFEAVFDNRDGGAFALMCALYGYGLLGQPQAILEDEYESFLYIATIRIHADPTPDGNAELVVILEGTPGARTADIDANVSYLEIAISAVAKVISQEYGAELHGRTYVDGATVSGRYTIRNVSGIIAGALQAR